MRDIKFRGKRLDNGEWVYGSLTICNAFDLKDGTHKPEPLRAFICKQNIEWLSNPDNKRWTFPSYEVDPETVRQYTGKHGIKGWIQDGIGKGLEIYEGDFLDFPTSGMGGGPCLVGPVNRYEKTKYGLEGYPRLEAGKVIGNDVENPELLEDAKGGE